MLTVCVQHVRVVSVEEKRARQVRRCWRLLSSGSCSATYLHTYRSVSANDQRDNKPSLSITCTIVFAYVKFSYIVTLYLHIFLYKL